MFVPSSGIEEFDPGQHTAADHLQTAGQHRPDTEGLPNGLRIQRARLVAKHRATRQHLELWGSVTTR